MWSLFAVTPKDEQRCIILLGKEFEAGGIFEGVNGVFLGETNAVWTFQSMEIGEKVVDKGGRGCATKQKGNFRVFVNLRFSLFQCSFGPRVLGLSVSCQRW